MDVPYKKDFQENLYLKTLKTEVNCAIQRKKIREEKTPNLTSLVRVN